MLFHSAGRGRLAASSSRAFPRLRLLLALVGALLLPGPAWAEAGLPAPPPVNCSALFAQASGRSGSFGGAVPRSRFRERFAVGDLKKESGQAVTGVVGLAPGAKAKAFEVKAADTFGIPLDDMVALSRNFHDDLTLDLSLGYAGRDGAAEISKFPTNLPRAYLWGMEHISPNGITEGDLLNLHRRAVSHLAVRDNKALRMQARPSVLQRKGASFTLRGEVSGEVKARMKAYGIGVTESPGGTSRIDYYSEPDSRALKVLVERINKVIQAGYSPAYVAAFAHQEIAIFHGFNGGNGRLGRLLAQILYKKLTGKSVVFPKEFHQELEHSAGDLANSLAVALGHVPVPYPPPNLTYLDRFAFRGISRDLAKDTGPANARSVPPALPPQVTVRDANTMQFASLDTAALPPDITHAQDALYYGRPAKSEEDAVKNMKILFQYGRRNRGGATFDVYSHVNDTRTGPRSGFFSASKTFWEAYAFAGRDHDGIVYVIDGAGAPGIDIEKLAKHLESKGRAVAPAELIDTEHEFALTGVDPRQIKGAWLRKGNAFEFVPNPNYDPHWRYPGP